MGGGGDFKNSAAVGLFENLPPLTQCFVSFEATFVPV